MMVCAGITKAVHAGAIIAYACAILVHQAGTMGDQAGAMGGPLLGIMVAFVTSNSNVA